jgi:hypothetical protein
MRTAWRRSWGALAEIAAGNTREREGLNEPLHWRKIIGQAIGIVMERFEINEDRAFTFLLCASSHGNLKLRDIAQELVDKETAVRRRKESARIRTQISRGRQVRSTSQRLVAGALPVAAPCGQPCSAFGAVP